MLLKVSDGNGGWNLFDNVEQAYLVSKRHTARNLNELNSLTEDGSLNLVSRDVFRGTESIEVGYFEFVRNGVTRKALFTNIVYVCNDSGDTLDKLSVRAGKGGK